MIIVGIDRHCEDFTFVLYPRESNLALEKIHSGREASMGLRTIQDGRGRWWFGSGCTGGD